MAQVRYEVGDRLLDDGVLYEVVSAQSNRWGGAVYRVTPVGPANEGMPRWHTPRFLRAKARVIDRVSLHELVHRFYAAVRADEALGPIFEARLSERWGTHLPHMVSFWASALLGEGSFTGEPMRTHRSLVGVRPADFARWLELFRETASAIYEEPVAEALQSRAFAMARGLSTGMFGAPFDAVA